MKTFTKSDLRSGMIVETKNKQKYVIIKKENDDLMLLGRDASILGTSYNENLEHTHLSSHDIMQVYDYPINKIFKHLTCAKTEKNYLVFERSIIDWDNVAIDTRVFVSLDKKVWHKRRFSRYEDGKVYVFVNGGDSWSSEGKDEYWEYVELISDEDNVSKKTSTTNEKPAEQKEEFRDIEGFSKYMISNTGRVVRKEYTLGAKNGLRTFKAKDMAIYYASKSRPRVSLVNDDGTNSNCSVAKLLAQAFVPNPENKKYVVLKDKNKPVSIDNVMWTNESPHHLVTWNENHRNAG